MKPARTSFVVGWQLLILVALLAAWQFLPTIESLQDFSPVFDPFIVSSPSMVAERMYELATASNGRPGSQRTLSAVSAPNPAT